MGDSNKSCFNDKMPLTVVRFNKTQKEKDELDFDEEIREEHFSYVPDAMNKALLKAVENGIITVNIDRTDRIGLTRSHGLYRLENAFLHEQESRNNTAETIRSYKKQFNNLYDFITFFFPKEVEDYQNAITKYGDTTEGRRKFASVLPMYVLEQEYFMGYYRDYLLNIKGVKEQTAISALRNFRVIYYFASRENHWLIPQELKINTPAPPIKQIYSQEELDILNRKSNIDNFVEYRNWVMIQYFMATGNRIGTLLGIKVGDIDFEESYVNANSQKNRNPTRISLVYKIQKILQEYIYYYRTDGNGRQIKEGYLFCSDTGGQLSYTSARDSFKDYCEKKGVYNSGFHKFRHTFAARWIRDGGDVLTLQLILGHKSLTMVQRYANLYSTDAKPFAEQHALITKMKDKNGRKKLKRRI